MKSMINRENSIQNLHQKTQDSDRSIFSHEHWYDKGLYLSLDFESIWPHVREREDEELKHLEAFANYLMGIK